MVPSICIRISVQSCAKTVQTGLATADSKGRDVYRGSLNMSKSKLLVSNLGYEKNVYHFRLYSY